MPGKEKDLRHAKARPDPNLSFTYNELMEELIREYDYPEREPGDVTAMELAAVTNLSDRTWINILNKKVRAGELEKVEVKPRGSRKSFFVYRKKHEH